MSNGCVIALAILGLILFFIILNDFLVSKNAKKKEWEKSESDLNSRQTGYNAMLDCYNDPR